MKKVLAKAHQDALANAVTSLRDIPKFEVLIRILSNHGDNTAVSCCEIDVLNWEKVPIPVESIVCLTPRCAAGDLSKLINKQLHADDRSRLWQTNWPLDPHFPTLDLLFTVRSDRPPKSLRIFPTRVDVARHINAIEVYVNARRAFKGEVTNLFGSVLPLETVTEDDPTADLFKLVIPVDPEDLEPIGDEVGDYPVLRFKVLEFIIDETADATSEEFTIGRIQVFDLAGTPLAFQNCLFEPVNCGDCTSLRTLFNTDKTARESSSYTFWRGTIVAEGRPFIRPTFDAMTRVSAIEIRHQDVQMRPGSGQSAVSKMRIMFDGRSIWAGRLFPKGAEESSAPQVSFLFFVSDPKLKEAVNAASIGRRQGRVAVDYLSSFLSGP
jgi:hypothetical protein